MKDLQLAKEEGCITRIGKNLRKARELLKIMACSENSEKFNAIFKNNSLTDNYNALQATALCLTSSFQPCCFKMLPSLFLLVLTSHMLNPLQSGCFYHNQQNLFVLNLMTHLNTSLGFPITYDTVVPSLRL